LSLSLQLCAFLDQNSLFLIDLLQYHLCEISAQFLGAASIQFDNFCYFLSQLGPESTVLFHDELVFLLEADKLVVDSFELPLHLLNGQFVGIQQGHERIFHSLQDGMGVDGGVELGVFVSGVEVELVV
jgi:hypothetical protein